MSIEPRDVLTLREAASVGLTESAVRNRVRTGRWRRVLRNVYVTHSGPIPPQTMLAVWLAYAGQGAVLSHGTAAHRHGLVRDPGPTHISVPGGRRVCAQLGLVLHYPRHLAPREVRVVRGLPCTSVERTVLDLVATARTPGKAAAVVVNAVGSRRTTAARLRLAWSGPGAPRVHRGVAREVLGMAERGLHSPLEIRADANNRAHRLPVGVWQFRVVLNGRTNYLDNLVDPYGLVTETDGRASHVGYEDRLRDNRRDNANVVAGLTPLRLGWEDLFDRPCELARERAMVLMRLGWPGPSPGCSPGCPAELRVSDVLRTATLTQAG